MGASLIKTGAFWSYCHNDNTSEDGLILKLADCIRKEYQLISAEEIEINTDKSLLSWGDPWRSELDDSLGSAQFFIAVVTPSFLRSYECCREVKLFAKRAEALGAKELFLPLLYADVPEITNTKAKFDDTVDADVINIIRQYQYETWIELRFEDPGSGSYRRGVHKLAKRLYESNRQIDSRLITSAMQNASSNAGEETSSANDTKFQTGNPEKLSSGNMSEIDIDDCNLVESLAELENQFLPLTSSVEIITKNIRLVGNITNQSTKDIEGLSKKGSKSSSYLLALNRLANNLSEPADEILENSKEYAGYLDNINRNIITVITRIKHLNKDADCTDHFSNILTMTDTIEVALQQTDEMKNSISSIIGVSRELNKPLRKIQAGLDIFINASSMMLGWRELIHERYDGNQSMIAITNNS